MMGLAKAGSTSKSKAIITLTILSGLDMGIFYHTKAREKKRKAEDLSGWKRCIRFDSENGPEKTL
jgi:hypothetical protein